MNWPPRRILVGTDFSAPAHAAVSACAGLARRTGAAIDLLHALPDPAQPITGYAPLDALLMRKPDEASVRTHAEQRLAALVAELGLPEVKLHLLAGRPVDELLALRELLRVDLVALGFSGTRGVRHFLLGSVADRVLRRPGCPLLLVREAPPAGEWKRIVIAQEYPDRATPWLELALRIAHAERAELTVLHVLPQRGYLSDAHHVELEPERAAERLNKLVAELDPTVPVSVETPQGDPEQVIAKRARELGAHLLVMGAERNRDGWPGKVTDRVARAGLPGLLVVWPDQEGDDDLEGE